MADLDTLRRQGIQTAAVVDALGIAIGGTRNVSALNAEGMQVACQVNSVGVEPNTSATQATLRARGLPTFCQVSELGVDPVSGDTLTQLRQRGIPAWCPVDNVGVALNGTATVTQLRQRGIIPFCPLDEGGTATTIGGPTIALSSSSINEDATSGTTVGVLSIANATGHWLDAITYSEIADPDTKFAISGANLNTSGALNFETQSSYSYTVQADNGTDTPITRVLTITVNNVAETPVNSVAPTFAGTAAVGQTLTLSDPGTWTDMGSGSFTYQWKSAGSNISGATSSSFTLLHAQAGTVITLAVTATNTAGNATATSAASSAVTEVPSNTVAPGITGTTQDGSTLTASTGTWLGAPTPSYSYVWKRDNVAIGGATASTYLLVTADVGTTITVTVIATNSTGTDSATSSGVGPISASGGTFPDDSTGASEFLIIFP